MTLIPMSGDLDDSTNWRPIALLQFSYKNLARFLYNHIYRLLEPLLSQDQFGFRPGRSTSEPLLIFVRTVVKRQ